jgi:hypothetical protein
MQTLSSSTRGCDIDISTKKKKKQEAEKKTHMQRTKNACVDLPAGVRKPKQAQQQLPQRSSTSSSSSINKQRQTKTSKKNTGARQGGDFDEGWLCVKKQKE